MDTDSSRSRLSRNRLESWKAIANYLQREVRTVQRWEQDEGLPVHRHEHRKLATVYAYKNEIDAWRAKREKPHTLSPSNRWWRSGLIALTVVGLAAVLLWLRDEPFESPGRSSGHLIVVLPFEDLSQEPLHPMADALTEELGARLASAAPNQLAVIARTSAMSFKGRRLSVKEIREELNVDYIVEGSIRSSGDNVRVTAQLVDAASDTREWTENFDYPIGGWLDLQEKASTDILAKVEASLQLGIAGSQPLRKPTQEAFEHILLGWHYFDQFQAATLGDAITHFSEANEIDPLNIDAHIGMSFSYAARGFLAASFYPQSYSEAERWAESALQINPDSGDALAVLGWVDFASRWDWTIAEQKLRSSVDQQPNSPWPHWFLANYLSALDRPDEAVEMIEKALRLDPVSPYILTARGYILANAGYLEEAIQHWLSVSGRVSPQVVAGFLRLAYERSGNFDAAIRLAAEMGDRSAESLAAAYSDTGEPGYWRAMSDQLESVAADNADWFSFRYVVSMAKIGKNKKALAMLERGYELRSPSMVFIKTYSLENLYGDPQYEELLEKMALLEK